ncbi:phosphatidate cytidylyltransferase [Trichoderma virens Gv29-8]|uniref:dolichol kinase n=1 Tax=Hypocrea virens (strain Gv29-8 / FGSC 10586) TaxID=413071 RepID=G9MHG1_HYPVG|nr:phosphatidate cytidylyltransferase [Trichoderma virens Gv29-8]EHK26149.1 phosphatidate cytidylyltransferase [Trichoderma virens Gv29-8]
MPTHLSPESIETLDLDEQHVLRALNRSPHPYHHQSSELPYPSDQLVSRGQRAASPKLSSLPTFSKESTPASDSGTDADDEHFLKGLPPPKLRPHKGLRGRNEVISGTSTPLLSPAVLQEPVPPTSRRAPHNGNKSGDRIILPDVIRRKKILVQRAIEAGIITTLAGMIQANRLLAPVLSTWRKVVDFYLFTALYGGLLLLYPFRVVAWSYKNGQAFSGFPLKIPTVFDPAPLLYPPAITIFVSLLVSVNNPAVILPNIILGISSIPQQVVPKIDHYAAYDSLHWALSCLPLIWRPSLSDHSRLTPTYSFLSQEDLVLLYPLHRTASAVLHHLTTTSLLTAELQLLSIALINVLLLASSPQIQILKALLWGGGLGVLVLCGAVIRWGIVLARVPKWRFRREPYPPRRPLWKSLIRMLSWQKLRSEILGSSFDLHSDDALFSTDEEEDDLRFSSPTRVQSFGTAADTPSDVYNLSSPTAENGWKTGGISRRHTTPHPEKVSRKAATHTPSGRRKRTASVSVRAYFKFTPAQAALRKWMYAGYVYVCLGVIIVALIRPYIGKYALGGNEPIGWALGYFFGDLPEFRYRVVRADLERWICLPPRIDTSDAKQCHLGWVQHVRHDDFGEASTRLFISGYWVVILIIGLAIVFQLKNTYEVDTRRKVFHFMMVGMLLPATYIDPTFVALALSIVLAIFLILDLLRASQLPPLSKPIASFLAPYVDGRDFRGPVVISHIFLLIGCAIPLWLSLGSLPRTGSDYLTGWEIPTREISMVSGVVCVGLGDAAASLIGRRYGHRKWLWGGGKSLEGSLAFTVAVFLGLTTASLWLRIGEWPVDGEGTSMTTRAGHAFVCSSMASLTEAVLTGGNDNVIVPVILWTCVKALEV